MAKIKLIVKGKILNYKNNNEYIYFKNGKIYQIKNSKKIFLCNLEQKRYIRFLSKFRILTRAFRLEPRVTEYINEKELLISYKGRIFNLNLHTKNIHIEHYFRNDMNNPLYFTKYQDDKEKVHILYGEYFANGNREEVAIYERIDGEWKKVYQFQKGLIQHIHNIIYIENEKTFYILTGDGDEESAIWMSNTSFKNVTQIFSGSQRFRSCFMYKKNDDIIYTTDTPVEANNLYVYRKKDLNFNLFKKFNISGPVIFGLKTRTNFYFSTSVESNSEIQGFKYLLSKSLGKGVSDNYSHLYCFDERYNIAEISKLKKDMFPGGLFQFGTIQILGFDNGIIVYCMGLKKYDGKTVLIT